MHEFQSPYVHYVFSVQVEGGGSGLLLRRGNPKDEGRYTCAAVSPAGNATLNINVQLISSVTAIYFILICTNLRLSLLQQNDRS